MTARAVITFPDMSINLGTIISMTDTVQKKDQVVPIVTQPMRNAFPIEMGNSHRISITFARRNPHGSSDPDIPMPNLSNTEWYNKLTQCVDRWQARTDGCLLSYFDDSGEGNMQIPTISVYGYIKSLTRVHKTDYNEKITGTLEFIVGSMYLNTRRDGVPEGAESLEKMDLMISDSANQRYYSLYRGSDQTCISSMTINGGPESPFEYVTIKMPKKKLQEFAEDLMIGSGTGMTDLVSGKNRITMNLMGERNMILAGAKISGEDLTIKAYCTAWLYQGVYTSTTYQDNALNIIKSILNDSQYGVSYPSSRIITNVSESDYDHTDLYIKAGVNVWRILQICAIYLGCKIFFADNNVYLINYRKQNISKPYCNELGNLSLYQMENDSFRMVGTVTIDQEGITPVCNTISVVCSDAKSSYNTGFQGIYSDDASVETFGAIGGNELSVPELTQNEEEGYSQADVFEENYLAYFREPQRSMAFTFKEGYVDRSNGGTYWMSQLGASARADSIYSSADEETITNRSVLKGQENSRQPQKLILSEYTRHFPKCTCEYVFGKIACVSLSDTLSKINTSLN